MSLTKITITFLIGLLASLTLTAQTITGQWNGILKTQGTQLRLVFNINQSTRGYTSTMDSPDQGAKGIPVTSTTFENSKLKLVVAGIGIEYNGELSADIITGVFKQNGQEFPLNLSRKTLEKEITRRPQEPIQPFPYYTENVTFQNPQANVVLGGTLSLPSKDGNFPVVVLISGSGPQNRDEEILGHKPFLVISDYLTRNGIAVLRYDDRGVGQSTGDFLTATSVDFATDVESAVAYLKTRKEINKQKIGLIGHSEGGIIAPMVASKSKDIQFIVLMAGTAVPGKELLLSQQAAIIKASGLSDAVIQQRTKENSAMFDLVLKTEDKQTLRAELRTSLRNILKNDTTNNITEGAAADQLVETKVNQLTSPWMLQFIKYDPALALEKVKCPVLAVNGEKDLQVASKENLAAIKKALAKGGNKNLTTMEFPGLNHLFQECKTGLPSEYETIEQTFSPLALDVITKWVITQTK